MQPKPATRTRWGTARTKITLNADDDTYALVIATQDYIEQLTESPTSLSAAISYLIKHGARTANITTN